MTSSSEDDSDDQMMFLGPDSDELDDIGPEPKDAKEKLLWASEKGDLDLVKKFLDLEPSSISYKDDDGYTALHRASYEGNVEIVKFLLSKGADVLARTNDGWTPLHSACKWNEPGVAAVLLDNGADINAQSHGLQTPLHLAASCKGARDLLVLLLSRKDVKADMKNSVKETAYDIARRTDKYSGLFDAVAPCVKEYC